MTFVIDNTKHSFRWFPGSTKLSDIREKYKYVTYTEVKEELKSVSEEEVLMHYSEYSWFFAKTIFIRGQRFVYAYFWDEDRLGEAINKSIIEDKEGI